MGAYLSEPVLEKHSTDEQSLHLSYGASGMQGWRVSQEVSWTKGEVEWNVDISLYLTRTLTTPSWTTNKAKVCSQCTMVMVVMRWLFTALSSSQNS